VQVSEALHPVPEWMMIRFLVLIAAVGGLVLMTGCSNGKLKCYPVTGQVLYNGEPLKGVDVAFHPVDPKNDTGYPPHATTDENGNFKLMTYFDGDGAPAGEWKVAVAFAVVAADDGADQSKKLVFQVPVEYQKKDTTPLNVSIKPETNTLEPFKLSGKPKPKK
jgi:hypothetical protein